MLLNIFQQEEKKNMKLTKLILLPVAIFGALFGQNDASK